MRLSANLWHFPSRTSYICVNDLFVLFSTVSSLADHLSGVPMSVVGILMTSPGINRFFPPPACSRAFLSDSYCCRRRCATFVSTLSLYWESTGYIRPTTFAHFFLKSATVSKAKTLSKHFEQNFV